MMCKCGAELSARALSRGGDYACDACYEASEEIIQEWMGEEGVEVEPPLVALDESERIFNYLVKKHDLKTRWLEGALSNTDERRVGWILAKSREVCKELVSQGERPWSAAEKALGLAPTPAR